MVDRKATPIILHKGTVADPRARIISMVEGFPEGAVTAHGDHLSLEVRTKRFGWLLFDHHGDGRLVLHLKADENTRESLQRSMPEHLHTPKYLGRYGWIGLWLDTARVDWSHVETALVEAYRMTAPKSLIQQLHGLRAAQQRSMSDD